MKNKYLYNRYNYIFISLLLFCSCSFLTNCQNQKFANEEEIITESNQSVTRSIESIEALLDLRNDETVIARMTHSLRSITLEIGAFTPYVVWWGDGTYSENPTLFSHTYTDNLDTHEIIIIGTQETLWVINTMDSKFNSIELYSCENLELLICGTEKITLPDCPNLRIISLNGLKEFGSGANFEILESIIFENCTIQSPMYLTPNLSSYMSFTDCQISEIIIDSNPYINDIEFGYSNIDLISISNCDNFNAISCSNGSINNLRISNMDNLNYFYMYGSVTILKNVSIENCNILKTIELFNLGIENLYLSAIPFLSQLDTRNNSLKSLDLSEFRQLTTLNISNNLLSEINFSNNPIIREVYFYGNPFNETNLINATFSLPNRVGLSSGRINYGSKNSIIDNTLANMNWINLYQE